MKNLCIWTELGHNSCGSVVKSYTCSQYHICLIHGGVGSVGAVHTHHTAPFFVGLINTANSHQARNNRHGNFFQKGCHGCSYFWGIAATACIKNRSFCRKKLVTKNVDGMGQICSQGGEAEGKVPGHAGLWPLFKGGGGSLHVTRNIDEYGARATRCSNSKGLGNDGEQFLWRLNHNTVLGNGEGKPKGICFLEGICSNEIGVYLTSNGYHGNGIASGIGNGC